MKYLKTLIILTVSVMSLFSCRDDDKEPEMIYIEDSPALKQITIKELMQDDGGPVTREENFYYNEGHKLVRYVSTQIYGDPVIENETQITYLENEAIIIDELNNKSIYTLNAEGYATSCIRYEVGGNTREYTFDYSTNTLNGAYLTGITEYVKGNIRSKVIFDNLALHDATLSVQSGDITNIFQLSFTQKNTSRLPWFFLTEIYPLNFHAIAMYARLLGDNPMYLLGTVQPKGGDEITTYIYTNDTSGQLSSYTEITRSNGKSYNRIINYIVTLAQ
ncbi:MULTISPECIES: DUF4595 domain-containing protein [Bacteroides]|uniref:DUF4595 domain-containing protein n=1 Tax=Bacteroides TaxID=816 RepID=UPI00189D2535|nr:MULTISPECIES: DUF4595 domain-containing protein [Bacteroides]MCE8466191.1 DUF4595 domain-containing protein [Bacteroides nordii]UYU47680.1 DUF4595 domain-containing protein [Bacteroides nordii]